MLLERCDYHRLPGYLVKAFKGWMLAAAFVSFVCTAKAATWVSVPYKAKYVNCYDGDTCTMQVLLGFGITRQVEIRICDIDTPELRPLKSRALAAISRDWINEQLSKAREIVIGVQVDPTCDGNMCEKQTFTRVLGYIMADGRDMGTEMIKLGLAKFSPLRCGE